jgi:hypothetical protein
MIRALLAALALALTAAAPAWATPNFPGAIQTDLAAVAAPSCSVCHANGVTGRGTVTTNFGAAMMARGMVAYDETALKTALDQMTADRVDSNGDGIIDTDALKQGLDPNAGGTSTVESPTYGCAVGRAPGPAAAALALLLVLGAALAAARRRARRVRARRAARR